MKKSMSQFGLIGVLATSIAAAGTAMASGEQIKFTDAWAWGQSTGGGPFEVQPINFTADIQGLGEHGAAAGRFLTFCVEKNEYFYNGHTYNAEINTAAVGGGVGGGSPDPLDERTAFLYAAFIRGNLDDLLDAASLGSSFVYENAASGAALQEAIWNIENEQNSISSTAQDLVTLAGIETSLGGSWYGKGIGSVRVLNITDVNGNPGQDQLVMIPLPIPAALGLAGLAGVGFITRKRRQACEA